jgi:hypothetical protein
MDGPKFRHWREIYGTGWNKPRLHPSIIEARTKAEMERSSIHAHHLVRFWIHANFLGDITLENTILYELVKWWIAPNFAVLISERTLDLVDRNTVEHSPLRRLCID